MEVSLGSLVMYFGDIFLFLRRFMSSPDGKKFYILKITPDDDQIAKTASQRNRKHLLVSNKGFYLDI